MTFRNLKVVTRLFASTEQTKVPQVCIIGAGPAGFYAAMHLTKNLKCNIDILEKLPVPFGLIRYGVAPDHPEVKNVINQFTKVAQLPEVNFYGNVTLGKDVSLHQLRENYDAVLLTYGAEQDKTLGIENEDARNMIGARHFVGWYNGLPSDRDLKIDLSCDTAAILGQGNVALDVARILLTPIDDLRKTDITEHALNALAESKIKQLYLIGRRGPLQVAFTIKELREQLKLKDCKTVWRQNDFENVSSVVPNLPRPRKRLTELMLKSVNENETYKDSDTFKYFRPIFFRSPNKILCDDKKNIQGVELTCTKLEGADWEHQKCISTDKTEIVNCGLVFRSIGYKSIKVDPDVPFGNGIVLNEKGCVLNESKDLGKVYVAGWLGTGPVGVILHTMGNAFQVAKTICDDLKNKASFSKRGFSVEVLKNKTDIVDWEGWKKIDNFEIKEGKARGKPREKICSVEKMIEIAQTK